MGTRVRIGMIGAGHIAGAQVRIWQQEAVVTAICSRQRPKAERLARDSGIPRVYDTAEELVRSSEVDAVSIATPHHLHHPFAMMALEAGKHVFCEKPLALNVIQARDMYAAAKRMNLKTGIQAGIRVGFPPLIHLQRLITEGAAGVVRYFEGVWGFDWAVYPDYPMSWRFKADESGAGALGDLGVYMIDAARWLAGEIASVSADMATFITQRPVITGTYDFAETRRMHRERTLPPATGWADVENDDACNLLIRFEHGAQGYIRSSRLYRHNVIRIEGSAGGFQWDMNSGQLLRRAAGEMGFTEEPVPQMPPESTVTRFLQNVTTGSDEPPTFLDGLRAQEVIEAAAIAAREQRWVNLSEIRRS